MAGRNGPGGRLARRHDDGFDQFETVAQCPVGVEVRARQGFDRIADDRPDRLAGIGVGGGAAALGVWLGGRALDRSGPDLLQRIKAFPTT